MTVSNTEEWRIVFQKYRDHPVLWQTNNANYKNNFLRNKAWADVLKEYKNIDKGATLDQLKKKMVNIRSCYRRELKKVTESERSGVGTDEVHVPSLWYFDCLEFLREHETPMEGVSTMDSENENSTSEVAEQQNKKRSRPLNKPKDRTEFLQKAVDYLDKSSIEKDEANIFAAGWACSYRKLSPEQRLYAKKVIDEALLLGQLNKLSIDTTLTPPSSMLGTPNSLSRSTTPLQQYQTVDITQPRRSQPFFLTTDSIILNSSQLPQNLNTSHNNFNEEQFS